MRTLEAAGRAFRLARRCLRVAGAVWRFARAHSPKWLVPVLAVCLVIIPGPFDELAVLAVVLVPVVRSRDARAELAGMVREAWDAKLLPA